MVIPHRYVVRSTMKLKRSAEPDTAQQNTFSARSQVEAECAAVPANFIRILLVDDHPVVRKGLSACLSDCPNLVVVGEASDGVEAMRKAGELSPDLVLMDVEMPVMNGLMATEAICKRYPKTKVLVLSMHDNRDYVIQAIQAGARGFALKTAPSEELIKAIEIIERGEPFFPGQSLSRQRHAVKNSTAGPDGLFEREKEVLVYLAMGYSNRDIGELLAISVRTVESHRARLMRKLNIHTIAGLTRYALTKGYISLNPEATFSPIADQGPHAPIPHGLRV